MATSEIVMAFWSLKNWSIVLGSILEYTIVLFKVNNFYSVEQSRDTCVLNIHLENLEIAKHFKPSYKLVDWFLSRFNHKQKLLYFKIYISYLSIDWLDKTLAVGGKWMYFRIIRTRVTSYLSGCAISYHRSQIRGLQIVQSMVEEGGSKRTLESSPVKATAKKGKKASQDDLVSAVIYDPKTMRKSDDQDGVKKIVSWNVAGLRAFLKKAQEDLGRLVAEEGTIDVFCIQEHKLQEGKHCEDATVALHEYFPGYSMYWNCSTVKKGYSGTAILSREKPLQVTYGLGMDEHDGEGRVVTAEYDSFYVVNVYVPNAGEGLKRLDYRIGEWDLALSSYIKGLESKGKAVILTGDMNCAAEEIDIHSPKTSLRSAGFTIEERTSFAEKYLQNGMKDALEH